MYKRKDYLEGRCSFEEYYGGIADACGLKPLDAALVARSRAALESGDEHLNSIPLHRWDIAAYPYNTNRLRAEMKRRGDFVTLAGLVCLAKVIYRRAASAPQSS